MQNKSGVLVPDDYARDVVGAVDLEGINGFLLLLCIHCGVVADIGTWGKHRGSASVRLALLGGGWSYRSTPSDSLWCPRSPEAPSASGCMPLRTCECELRTGRAFSQGIATARRGRREGKPTGELRQKLDVLGDVCLGCSTPWLLRNTRLEIGRAHV